MIKRVSILLFVALFGQTISATSLIAGKEITAFKHKAKSLISVNVAMIDKATHALKCGIGLATVANSFGLAAASYIVSIDGGVELLAKILGKNEGEPDLSDKKFVSLIVRDAAFIAFVRFLYTMTSHALLIRNLQKTVSNHADVTLKELQVKEVMMIVAAHEKNLLMMQHLSLKVSDFLNQDGIWDALTALYVNGEATDDMISDLKKAVLV